MHQITNYFRRGLIMCSKCGESSYYKSGKANGKQRLAAVASFRKGLSLRSIAEIIGANNVIILYWTEILGSSSKIQCYLPQFRVVKN